MVKFPEKNLYHIVSVDFKTKQMWKKYTRLLTIVDHCTSYKNCMINASQTCLKRKAKKLILYYSENYGYFVQGSRTRQHVMAS